MKNLRGYINYNAWLFIIWLDFDEIFLYVIIIITISFQFWNIK